MTTREDAVTAAGLAAYVLVVAVAWGTWKLIGAMGWSVPEELLAIPAVAGGLVIAPASAWCRRALRRD